MGIAVTVAVGLLMALMSIRLGVDIYIAGMAVNILGTGLTTFLIFVLTGSQGSIIYPEAPRLTKFATPLIEKSRTSTRYSATTPGWTILQSSS
jgi:simple sugar transport system permease protein